MHMKNDSNALPSRQMTKPYWLEDEQLRRECVLVDGDLAWDLICACADGDNDKVRALLDYLPSRWEAADVVRIRSH